jgi:hypothetical protein
VGLVHSDESDSTAVMMQLSEAARQTCRGFGAYIHNLAIQDSGRDRDRRFGIADEVSKIRD